MFGNSKYYIELRMFVGQVWWSPCRSRECPDDEQLSLVLHECVDHCLLQQQKNNSKDLSYHSRAPTHILCTTKNVSFYFTLTFLHIKLKNIFSRKMPELIFVVCLHKNSLLFS